MDIEKIEEIVKKAVKEALGAAEDNVVCDKCAWEGLEEQLDLVCPDCGSVEISYKD